MTYNLVTTMTFVWTVIRKRLTQSNYHSLITRGGPNSGLGRAVARPIFFTYCVKNYKT